MDRRFLSLAAALVLFLGVLFGIHIGSEKVIATAHPGNLPVSGEWFSQDG